MLKKLQSFCNSWDKDIPAHHGFGPLLRVALRARKTFLEFKLLTDVHACRNSVVEPLITDDSLTDTIAFFYLGFRRPGSTRLVSAATSRPVVCFGGNV